MKTKISLLAGYVESGRSSLIRKAVSSCPPGLSIAVAVDSVQELELDRDLFAEEQPGGIHEVQLKNGCMLTSLANQNVFEVLLDVCKRGYDYALVEGSSRWPGPV